MSPAGVGIGWRREIASELLGRQRCVDFVEVVAERCFAQPAAWREARALAEIWPVVVHGVKLSLGTADGIDERAAARLGELVRSVRAPVVSEHVALTRVRSRELGHLTAVPFHRDMVKIVARNASRARRHFSDVPFLLENIAWTMRWPEDAMPEGAFYEAIARESGCGLLLDVANLYANARNAGIEPLRALREFPLERVAMIHVAGGVEEDGFYFDTHAHPVSGPVLALLAEALRARPGLPVVLERDAAFPPFAELEAELARVRASGASTSATPALASQPPPEISFDSEGLAARQEALARALTASQTRCPSGFDEDALERTRRVLEDKRVDDAVPLLPALERLGIEAYARARLPAWPRSLQHAGPNDAWRLARAARAEPALSDAAKRDELALRARFAADATGVIRPRRAPFVGRARVGGASLWAIKGPGCDAPVHLYERRRS